MRIGIERQESAGQRVHSIADVPPHQQPAVLSYVVAERQLREVAPIERDEQSAEESTEDDAAGAFVGRHAVGVALRVIELLLTCLHVRRCSYLAEVDPAASLSATANCSAPACC
jgi:hypothetical protein